MMRNSLFEDRADGGRLLGRELAAYRGKDVVVLGLPRGGVVTAYEVARALGAPLDVCVVRKIGAPIQPELGIGAVAEDGALYVDRARMRLVGVSEEELEELVAVKRAEVDARVERFRGGAPPVSVEGKTVLLVDDGVATGGTARAAILTTRQRGAARVVLAVPVGASDTLDELATIADEVVCPRPEDDFMAVGLWYEEFGETTDDDVVAILERARSEQGEPARPHAGHRRSERVPAAVERDIVIPIDDAELEGHLSVPPDARGLVIFAHGSGSSRKSSRNRYVAGELVRAGVGTLLFDLLTADEERVDARTAHLRFDIGLLAERLVRATDWAHARPELRSLAIGLFGASTGAAAALVAAAARPEVVRAVVSRGGRPDLAAGALARVRAPTLLLVGGRDVEVLALNRQAHDAMSAERRLEVVPGATHLFEEPGTLEHVARSAARWFSDHLGRSRGLEAAG